MRSWWCRMPSIASSRKSISRTISSPRTGCSWIAANSASVRPPGLLQHPGRDAELADVVQHPGVAQRGDPVLAHADRAGDEHRRGRHPLAVTAGVEVLGLDRGHQGAHRAVVGALFLGVLGVGPPGDASGSSSRSAAAGPTSAPRTRARRARCRTSRRRGRAAPTAPWCPGRRRAPGTTCWVRPDHTSDQGAVHDAVRDIGRQRRRQAPGGSRPPRGRTGRKAGSKSSKNTKPRDAGRQGHLAAVEEPLDRGHAVRVVRKAGAGGDERRSPRHRPGGSPPAWSPTPGRWPPCPGCPAAGRDSITTCSRSEQRRPSPTGRRAPCHRQTQQHGSGSHDQRRHTAAPAGRTPCIEAPAGEGTAERVIGIGSAGVGCVRLTTVQLAPD